MCLILSLGCCGCSSPKPCHKQKQKQKQTQEQICQQQTSNHHSDNIQLNETPAPPSPSSQVTTSQPSLPSMSPSLMALPHRIATSSTLSSWAGEEELYNVDDYEDRTPTRWTAWWLKGASVSDQVLGGHSSVVS
ncbi:uncharacterized protein LOC108097030 [Drosophila ficusphila]|uniref:uncharacterized protein LOC108097030 n=1 Tax=Drosophila ficusphila TaxID=30025 RepID=UPI0007E6624C|nr:uncharacterized protein LOC108097030 [Drosophila ficusphila]XP_017054538.1 uncharacterized protein LOC108097030 [Drosophila ficusphila]